MSILILLIVGILIGTWIISGVVPSMIYYGLNILDTHTLCVTEIEKGNATWDDYTLATDVHPNKTQGEKIAELAFNEFIQNADKYIRSIKMMPKKYGSDDYTKPCHVSSSDL